MKNIIMLVRDKILHFVQQPPPSKHNVKKYVIIVKHVFLKEKIMMENSKFKAYI